MCSSAAHDVAAEVPKRLCALSCAGSGRPSDGGGGGDTGLARGDMSYSRGDMGRTLGWHWGHGPGMTEIVA